MEEMERAALQRVVRSFTVTPEAVETGGSVTVAWKVTVPDSNVISEFKLGWSNNRGTRSEAFFPI